MIFDIVEYNKILENIKYTDTINYYGQKKDFIENEFWVELLKLSNNRCFYCGDLLTIETYEREHRIDKKIFGDIKIKKEDSDEEKEQKYFFAKITKELKRSKYNLIPCCRLCNGRKKLLNVDEVKKRLLKIYHKNKKLTCKGDVDYILRESDYLQENIEIDWITFEIKSNIKKSKILKIKNKIFDSIEKLILKDWKNPESYLEEKICNFINGDNTKKEYLKLNYFLNYNIIDKLDDYSNR